MPRVRFRTALTPDQPNIFVENSGLAYIADFGLAKIIKNQDSVKSASYQNGYTIRWAAPEVFIKAEYGREADIFSLAMVMIEVRYGWSIV